MPSEKIWKLGVESRITAAEDIVVEVSGVAAVADAAATDATQALTDAATAQETADNLDWLDYTPTVSATAGTITSYTSAGKYKQIGHTVFVSVKISITDNGTASNSLIVSLPVAVAPAGQGNSVNSVGIGQRGDGKAVTWVVSPAAQIGVALLYDGTYPGLSGYQLDFSLVYVIV